MKRRRIFLFLYSMSDSGTSQEMAEKLHSPSVLCDLNPHPSKRIGNWNALKDKVGHSADLIFFHLPYHDIIQYSGNMWGRPHEDDLSRCENYEDYIEKMMDILVSRNPDSGNMETGIPERKPPLIGLINTHKESNECQAQSRFAGHKPALHL